MAKNKIAPAEAGGKVRVPLSDVTITCSRQAHFFGEDGATPITIPGRQIEQVLKWLLQTSPGVVGQEKQDLWTADSVALNLEGLGEVLRGLAEANLEETSINMPSMLSFLAAATEDLAARLSASCDEAPEGATVTLPGKKEKEDGA